MNDLPLILFIGLMVGLLIVKYSASIKEVSDKLDKIGSHGKYSSELDRIGMNMIGGIPPEEADGIIEELRLAEDRRKTTRVLQELDF